MTEDIQRPSPSKTCTVEVYPRTSPGTVEVSYYVREIPGTGGVPNPDPISIIAWDETYEVIVDVVFKDTAADMLCGSLCVDIDIDTCGPAPDKQLPEQRIELDPKNNSTGEYQLKFQIPAGTFEPDPSWPARCGRVYRLCVTVGSTTPNGKPGPIWALCEALDIVVHAPIGK